jgi:hypothetical protein
MKLRCIIGSMVIMKTKPRMVLQSGDVFEIDEKIGKQLLETGYVEEIAHIVETPAIPPIAPEDQPNPPDIELVLEIQKPKSNSRRRR